MCLCEKFRQVLVALRRFLCTFSFGFREVVVDEKDRDNARREEEGEVGDGASERFFDRAVDDENNGSSGKGEN